MNERPCISVVIPAYNAERFLGEALDSVFSQTYTRLEVIVIDDGSTDNTLDVARRFSGVRCFSQANGGIGAARNTGVGFATGELLAFLDADDLWPSEKLSRQTSLLHSEACDIVFGAVEHFVEGNPTALSVAPSAPLASAMLLRRSDFLRVGPFATDQKVGEFLDWHSRAQSLGLRMLHDDQLALRRRVHGDNTVIKHRSSQRDYLQVLQRHLARKRAA